MSEVAWDSLSLETLMVRFDSFFIVCIDHLFVCAMMRNIVGTRAEAPVGEQNRNCSPILSAAWMITIADLVRHHSTRSHLHD